MMNGSNKNRKVDDQINVKIKYKSVTLCVSFYSFLKWGESVYPTVFII